MPAFTQLPTMGFATGAIPEEPVPMAFHSEISSLEPNTEVSNLVETFSQVSLGADSVAPMPDTGQQIDPSRYAMMDGFQDANAHQALMRLKGKGKGQGKPGKQRAPPTRCFGNNFSCSV